MLLHCRPLLVEVLSPQWFVRWSWLHYRENDDAVTCIECIRPMKQDKLNWSSNLDRAFISRGFSNWKDASVKFANHEKSNCHQEAVLKTVTIPTTTSNVAEILST